MDRFKNGILSLALICLIIGAVLKIDRSILTSLGLPENWLHWVQVIDHTVFPIGALLFLAFILIQSRALKREASDAKAPSNTFDINSPHDRVRECDS